VRSARDAASVRARAGRAAAAAAAAAERDATIDMVA
jgi:hypothetical protein